LWVSAEVNWRTPRVLCCPPVHLASWPGGHSPAPLLIGLGYQVDPLVEPALRGHQGAGSGAVAFSLTWGRKTLQRSGNQASNAVTGEMRW
jgi:hypothetical protein